MKLNNFICTKAKPSIFYKPRAMNSTLENKLKETAKFVEGISVYLLFIFVIQR